ncbi:IclR family transcriptional regulator [Rhodococcus cercidiphylli]|uniref:IclR family transcriptional regulator n=1 Tax=Rhodococcus cercidiphylli TaxID=489916 RepID=A0ABU4B3R6_9NOCA|nr:IclR family transcriptional regulator [Rhodococcus cercidiphylli]MDV6233148.1 IclR family transcriptional regulator [Rhodococcus cercidiphylli]
MSQSLARAMTLLGLLGDGPQSLDELASVLEVHKTTVLRLLRTMEADRFVQHDADHRYQLGSRLFELANRALEQRDVRSIARPHLSELNAITGQTVHLATYEAGVVIYIDKFDAQQSVRMYSRIGKPAPLHCTAVGKVLISARPEAERVQIARNITYTPFTERTITTAERYLRELDLVREQGFAEDREEHESFVNCIGCAVRNGTGDVVAAVSMSVPDMVLDHQQVLATLPEVQHAAAAISAGLGWHPQEAQDHRTQNQSSKEGTQ